MIASETRTVSSTQPDLTEVVARAARFAVAGGVAGFLGIGLIGLRGTMRLLTITSGEAGRFTGNGNRAGDFTFEGTLFLVLAGTFIGVMMAFVYGAIRRGLPKSLWLSAVLTAPLLARVVVLDPNNIDFARFGPIWVAVAGFTFGAFVYTLTLEATLRWLETRWRLPTWASLVLAGPPAALLTFQVLVGAFGLDLLRLGLYALIGGLLVAWWRGVAWLEHLPTVLAVLWITGGIAWWFRTVVDLT
jgi:uncharacterized protein (DUF983 family)